uniref:Uncharacterized protein n=1 Tax=Gallus gallus TaxID=9031 RepID=A0A8V0XF55_CHICK
LRKEVIHVDLGQVKVTQLEGRNQESDRMSTLFLDFRPATSDVNLKHWEGKIISGICWCSVILNSKLHLAHCCKGRATSSSVPTHEHCLTSGQEANH